MKIDYYCHSAWNGYSESAKNYILSLQTSNYWDLKVYSLDGIPKKQIYTSNYDNYCQLIDKNRKPDVNFIHLIPDKIRFVKNNMKSAAMVVFEANTLPDYWKGYMNTLNAIATPSRFCLDLFKGIDKPVYHIPHAIDDRKYNFNVISHKNEDKLHLLCIATNKKRKNLNNLIIAMKYLPEINLTIKTDNYGDLIETIKNNNINNVNIDIKVYSEDDIPIYMKSFDCVISSSLGEGFGLPTFYAIALGLPIIVPKYSGFLDYANSNNSIFIEIDRFEKIKCLDNYVQFRDKEWPVITSSNIVKAIQNFINNKKIFSVEKLKSNSEEILDNYSFKNTECKMKSLFVNLQ